jgi:hypothetical protein
MMLFGIDAEARIALKSQLDKFLGDGFEVGISQREVKPFSEDTVRSQLRKIRPQRSVVLAVGANHHSGPLIFGVAEREIQAAIKISRVEMEKLPSKIIRIVFEWFEQPEESIFLFRFFLHRRAALKQY